MDPLLQRLPPRPRSAVVRAAIATALVAFGFALVLGVHRQGLLGFYILLPCVFVASVLLGRGAGVYAALASTVLLYFMVTPRGSVLLPAEYIVSLAGFLVIALGFAIVSDALRVAFERAAAAERAKDLLLRELAHRTKNNLMMVTSLLAMQARLKTSPEAREALEKAIIRIDAIASAHEYFQPVEHQARVEMRAYLSKLCGHLADALHDVRAITMRVDAAEVLLAPEQAIALGLIANELVTNALKHAFPDGRAGMVEVVLSVEPTLTLLVRDNGVGCPATKTERVGSCLVRLLTQQLGATIEWEQPRTGCQVSVVLPSAGPPNRHKAGSPPEPRSAYALPTEFP